MNYKKEIRMKKVVAGFLAAGIMLCAVSSTEGLRAAQAIETEIYEAESSSTTETDFETDSVKETELLPETDFVKETELLPETDFVKETEPMPETDLVKETEPMPETDFLIETESEFQTAVAPTDMNEQTEMYLNEGPVTEMEELLMETEEIQTENMDLEFLEIEEKAAVLLADSYSPPGELASSAGTGYTAVSAGDRRYSGKYSEVQRNKASEVTVWDNSGGNIIKGTRINSGGKEYVYVMPKNDSAAGKFGFRVTNVAYNRVEKCNVDMILTVTAYNDYAYSSAGNKIEGVYPCIGYTPGGGIAYQPFLPAIRFKCDLVKAGTSIPVAGDYRFTVTDIDAGQIYGITLYNGKIDAKYCTKNTVIHTETRTLSDGYEYYMMYAPDISSSETNKNHAMSYEVSNMSSFSIFINSAKKSGTTGGYSGNAIREAYADIKDGSWDTTVGALLGWDSWAFGPAQVSPLYKYVSNNGQEWFAENKLTSIDSEYWYMLEVYVPEMSGYSYQQFYLQDILPAGVDYAGEISAIQTETGEDASKYFSISTGDTIVVNYNGTSGFQGYTYQIRLKVKLDVSEVAPVIQDNLASYTVQNQGTLYYQTNADESVLSTPSNQVATRAEKSKPIPEKPVKKIDVSGTLVDEKEFTGTKNVIIFTIRQKIPAYETGWYMSSFEFEDVLEDCFELVQIRLYKGNGDSGTVFKAAENGMSRNGWTFHMQNGKVSAVLKGDSIQKEHYDGNTTYQMDLSVKIKEGYDLFPYYQTISGEKLAAVIRNKASSNLVWGSENLKQETNTVKVLISEITGRVELQKTNQNTGENVSNAGFVLYEWNEKDWKSLGMFAYDKASGKYTGPVRLKRTEKNQGKFRIEEQNTPAGFVGKWEREFVLDGTYGTEQFISFTAENKMATGTLTVKKSSESGQVLPGAVYEIYAKEAICSPGGQVLYAKGTYIASLKTGADGTATQGGLYPGSYEVKEKQPPAGYLLNTDSKTIQIRYLDREQGASDEIINFHNMQTSVSLRKVSRLAINETEKKPLSGVVFAVWNKNSQTEKEAASYTTDQNGMITLRGFHPGIYCYKELSALEGYVLDQTIREFTIDQNGYCMNREHCMIEIENQLIHASFDKKDKATGKPIAGAKMTLSSVDGMVVDTWISGEKPHVIERIPAGNYLLTELEAPKGYKLADPIQVEILEKSDMQSFTMRDVKYVTITLHKKILKEDVVWAHGNPIFSFCLEGTDLDGEAQGYYESVEIQKDSPVKKEGSDLYYTATVRFTVPAGMYTAYETNVIRYKLEKIDQVVNGTVSGPAVLFDLKENQDGSAAFYNEKINDAGISDTDWVRNIIIE